ncbi:hypothetical protein [Actinophytocola sp.]|uniref:hypothetical protein n=1 Tax=Actinophytocola sp. TaxID=1872138 RepID=UPI002ED38FD7
MRARCPQCSRTVNVRLRRGDRIASHACDACGTALQGATAGKGKGRYLCPITGFVYELGLRAIALHRPYRLVFRAGLDTVGAGRQYYRNEPLTTEQAHLDRVAGRTLGPGCVVAEEFDPSDPALADESARAGLRMVPAELVGNPEEWVVNERLTYRACSACAARIPDLPNRHVPHEWRPRRTHARRGRGRTARSVDLNPGPYPAGTLACADCDPRT